MIQGNSLSLRVPLRKTAANRERVRRSGRNGGRLCLREGETETEVTNLPKNPAEMENVTVSEKKKKRSGRKVGQRKICYRRLMNIQVSWIPKQEMDGMWPKYS